MTNKKNITPIWESPLLNVEEASDYFRIGMNKIRELTDGKNNPYVLWIGTKRMIKRAKLEEYLMERYSA